MARRSRKGEVVCTCKAYPFPHRLMGGDCVGRRIVVRYWNENCWSECQNCMAFEHDPDDGYQCQVVNGQEETWYCQGLLEVLHYEEVPVPRRLNMKGWP